jgi:hypothetical protein
MTRIRKTTILAGLLALAGLPLTSAPAGARLTRELVASIGNLEKGENYEDDTAIGVSGLAVDLETGNVYVANNLTQTIDIVGPTGGAPTGGVPTQITGIHIDERENPAGIAVDNSCYEHQPTRLTGKECEEYDPSYGDVYVIDTNTEHRHPMGAYEGIQKYRLTSGDSYELVGEIEFPGGPSGVAVDFRGNVYGVGESYSNPVLEFKKNVEKVVTGGKEEIKETLQEIRIPRQEITRTLAYVAPDGLGDLYLGTSYENGGASEGWLGLAKLKLGAAGELLSEEPFGGNVEEARRPVAIAAFTNVAYVGDRISVAEYDAAGALQLEFGSTQPLGGSLTHEYGLDAIAVNGVTGLVYVGNPGGGDVQVFGSVIGPPVFEGQQPAVVGITRTTAQLASSVNPASIQDGEYDFEYVAESEYEPSAPDPYADGGRTAVEALPGGHAPETIEKVALTGLRPGTTYHYRMVATNAAETVYGPDETFTTSPATPPTVSTGAAGEVTATTATLTGVVGALGLPTSYVFEVGATTAYEGARLFGNAGSGTGTLPVSVSLQYLVPGTTYHYRLSATSFDGTTYGQDGTFTTPGVPSPIVQPPAEPLIASPSVQFPSIAGAITKPVGAGRKSGKRAKHGKRHGKRRAAKSTGRRRARHAGKRR